VILAGETLDAVGYAGVAEALAEPDTQVLLFGKPDARPNRRMGVALATGTDLDEARTRADRAAARVRVVPAL
jgi:phosphoribosylglycinamide formyltransferase 2